MCRTQKQYDTYDREFSITILPQNMLWYIYTGRFVTLDVDVYVIGGY